jgi:hypothetical protein
MTVSDRSGLLGSTPQVWSRERVTWTLTVRRAQEFPQGLTGKGTPCLLARRA